MRILTMCQGGNCRSVALAYILKYGRGHDALACGWEGNSPETVRMLCEWAEKIYVVQPQFVERVPADYRNKVSVLDVGEDRWFQIHPELLQKFTDLLDGRTEA